MTSNIRPTEILVLAGNPKLVLDSKQSKGAVQWLEASPTGFGCLNHKNVNNHFRFIFASFKTKLTK